MPFLVVGAIALLIVLFFFGRFCSAATTIDVTINGAPLTIHGAKTMQVAIKESGLPINPGDLISLSGTVLKKSDGYPFAATVNGTETSDPDYQLHSGDVIVVKDGKDRLEEYDAYQEPKAHNGSVVGLGAICVFEAGQDGVLETRTGRISGDVVQQVTTQPIGTECTRYNPNVGDDKVLALTFDEGPSGEFTGQILDILKQNEAKATFFCTGEKIEGNADLVKRERSEGHQVCSSTYSLLRTGIYTGTFSGSVEPDRLAEEVQRGQQALADALGGEQPSKIVRMPLAELTGELAAAVDTMVEFDIGWNLDTGDWMQGDANEIYDVLMQAESGDVIALHDGYGDRSNTISALKKALPLLKNRGFSFITIDELMKYPSY